MTRLEREARALAERLADLWLGRSHVSEMAMTARRIDRAIASLRRAAKVLAANRPPAVPPEHTGFSPGVVIRLLRESVRVS